MPWSSPRSQHHAAVAQKIHLSRLFRFPQTALLPLAVLVLLVPGPSLLTANCFAMLLRTGAGLASVVRGAVPVALFGTDGLGQRLSRLAVIRTLLGAAAPFAFALASAQIGLRPAPWLVVASGAAGLVVMALLWRDIGRLQAAPAAA